MSILKRIQGTPSGNQNTPSTPSSQDQTSSQGARRVAAPNIPSAQDTYQDLKNRVQNKLISTLEPTTDPSKVAEVRRTIQELFEQILSRGEYRSFAPRTRPHVRADRRRNSGLWPAAASAGRRDHHRNHGQRRQEHLHRARRAAFTVSR